MAVDDAAKSEGVSGNVWAMRCIERCLSFAEARKLKALVDEKKR
jgi:hypothetical protein